MISELPKAFFVSGTDTGVGKTVVSAILALGLSAHYWKPIQSGCVYDDDSDSSSMPADGENTDSQFILKSGVDPARVLKERYVLRQPLSPHLAARLDGVSISLEDFQMPDTRSMKHLIIEGAGGLLVPINDRHKVIDLIQHFDLPVVLVARSKLGTINHTLLSLEVLRNRGIEIAGVIMCGEPNAENKNAIERYGDVKVLAEVPPLPDLSKRTLLSCFENSFQLKSFGKSSERESPARI